MLLFVMQVVDKFNPPDKFLPESYTCFFLLKLPCYTSKAVMRDKLKYAIHFCKSIDTDDYARIALTGEPLEDASSDESESEATSVTGSEDSDALIHDTSAEY